MTQHGCQQPVAALIATSMCSSRTMRSGPLTVPAAQPAARRSWVVGWSEVGGEWQLTEGDGLNVLIGEERTRPEREGVRSKQVSAKTYILLFYQLFRPLYPFPANKHYLNCVYSKHPMPFDFLTSRS